MHDACFSPRCSYVIPIDIKRIEIDMNVGINKTHTVLVNRDVGQQRQYWWRVSKAMGLFTFAISGFSASDFGASRFSVNFFSTGIFSTGRLNTGCSRC